MSRISPIGKLTDAVFGFALAVGALSLTSANPQNAGDIAEGLVLFTLSFIILVVIWWGTSDLMSKLDQTRAPTIVLNIVLLFFVAIEPYFLNILNSSVSLFPLTSTLYAVDMAALMAISAALCHILVNEEKEIIPEQQLGVYRAKRNNQLVFAGLFLFSAFPLFLEWTIGGMNVRVLIWLATLALAIATSARKSGKQKSED
jgi:uncharacterized membrane protein